MAGTEERAANILGPQRLTVARAKDAIKERNRKKKAYEEWSSEYVKVSGK